MPPNGGSHRQREPDMKPFLCTDITLDKHNETISCEEFFTARPSEMMSSTLSSAA